MYLQKIIISLMLFFISINTLAKETLIFAIDIVRHGDRTSEFDIPKALYKWPQGQGQLTALGMQQEFQLGTSFRKKYVDEYHLLPESYQNGTMLVFSTDFDRTLMSAQSLLLGLYPFGTGPLLPGLLHKPALPNAFQPVPIHVRALKNKAFKVYAEKYHNLIEKHVFTRTDWKEKTIQLKQKFQRWNQLTGLKLTNIPQLGALANTLTVYKLHNIPMPPGLSAEDIEEIIAAGTWGRVVVYKTKEIAIFFTQPMLTNIADYLQKASQHETPLKYIFFSDHNTTITHIMTLLQNPLDELPQYTANINFALFKTDDNNFLVKISYNGNPVVIPGCNTQGCTLKQFAKLAKSYSVNDSQKSA